MFQNPMSKAVLSRPGSWAEPAPPYPPPASRTATAPPQRTLRTADRQILALLGAHEVLTSGQLVRLTGLPERTVQHRLGLLCRAGLLNRVRPPREVGTSPYHCWLTAFGAMAARVEEATAWSEDPSGVAATAALSELWLSVRDHAEEAELSLIGWRRLADGLAYRDPRTETPRAVPVEAELTVTIDSFAARTVTAPVAARVEGVPTVRLAVLLARFAAAGSSTGGPALALAVLARTPRVAEKVLTATDEVGDASAARRLDATALAAARKRVTVGVVEPHPVGLATEAVWSTPADRRPRRLVEVLAECGGSAR